MFDYKVIEDNAGGLYLFVFKNEELIYTHSEYEHSRGQLKEDIKELEKGQDPTHWEGNEEEGQESFDLLCEYMESYGAKLVCDKYGLYPENMGFNACLEFNVEL